jgi:predicted ATPase
LETSGAVWLRLFSNHARINRARRKSMKVRDCLYRARVALSTLVHLSLNYETRITIAPGEFGVGLSVLLGYIGEDVTAAYLENNKLQTPQPAKDAEEDQGAPAL